MILFPLLYIDFSKIVFFFYSRILLEDYVVDLTYDESLSFSDDGFDFISNWMGLFLIMCIGDDAVSSS